MRRKLHHDPAALLDKRDDSVVATLTNPNIFGSPVSITLGGSANVDERTCLNESVLNMSFIVSNTGNVQVPFVCKLPASAWVRNYQLTWTDKHGAVHTENSYTPSGLVSGILSLMEDSYSNQVDMASMFFAVAPVTITDFRFEICLNLKYLIATFFSKRYLGIRTMNINLNFLALTEIFDFPASQTNWAITCTNTQLFYSRYILDIPRVLPMLLQPNPMRMYIQQFGVLPGSTSVTNTLNVGGSLSWISYFYNNSANTYNAWPSLPVTHQLQQMGGEHFPSNSQFNVTNPSDPYFSPTFGWMRHYRTFMDVLNKLSSKRNTYITADTWKSSYRIYSIMCASKTNGSPTYTLTIQMNEPAPTAMNIIVFGLFLPTSFGTTAISNEHI